MAGSKVSNYSTTYTSLTYIQLTLDASRYGYNNIELTNMSTVAKPNIAAGSIVECGGALYQFSTEEPISTVGIGSTTDQTYFIKLVPSSSQCTAIISTTVPVYRTDYHGWYENSTSINRYVGFTKIESGNYNNKTIFYNKEIKTSPVFYNVSGGVETLDFSTGVDTLIGASYAFDCLSECSSKAYTPKQSGMYNFGLNIQLRKNYSSAVSTGNNYFYLFFTVNSTTYTSGVIFREYVNFYAYPWVESRFFPVSLSGNVSLTTADSLRCIGLNQTTVSIGCALCWPSTSFGLFSHWYVNKI